MQGNKIQAAVTGVRQIVGMMDQQDLFGLFTFDSQVKNLHHAMPVSGVNVAQDEANIKRNCERGGCTAFLDAIVAGIDEMRSVKERRQGRERLVYEHIVLTDGEDNSSQLDYGQVSSRVSKPGLPNYHLVLIAVGVESSTEKKMRSLCSSQHATFISVRDVRSLATVLFDQATRIRLSLSVTQEGMQSRMVANTRPSRVEHTLRAMDQAAGSSIGGNVLNSLTSSLRRLTIQGPTR